MHNVHNSDGDCLSYMLPTSKAKYLCKLSVILMDAVVHTAIIFYYVTARIRVFSISLCYKPKIPTNSGLKSPSVLKPFSILQAYSVHAGRSCIRKVSIKQSEKSEQNTDLKRLNYNTEQGPIEKEHLTPAFKLSE